MPPEIAAILEKCGFKAESFEKVRLGSGVVGKTAPVAIAVSAVAAIAAFRAQSDLLLLFIITGVFGGFFWYFRKILAFAKENPALAILEGAEFVAYKQMEVAAKDLPAPPKEPAISNPVTSGQSLIHIENKE